jgi:hypothetical protein
MLRKTFVAVAVVVASLTAAAALAQDGGLRFEKTVPYRLDQSLELGARMGPVRVDSVVLSTGSAGGVRGSIMSRVRPGAGDSDVRTTLRAGFDTQNPSDEEWEVTYTVEFLDRDGKVIDRATKKGSVEGEAKIISLEHSTLSYVVPFISRVRIRMSAKID